MANRVVFKGDSLGGWTHAASWPDGWSLDMVAFEEDKPVRAGELNLISQENWLKLRDHVRRAFTDGWALKGTLHGTISGTNSIAIDESWFNAAGQTVHVGNPDSGVGTKALVLAMGAPPVSGTRVDFV